MRGDGSGIGSVAPKPHRTTPRPDITIELIGGCVGWVVGKVVARELHLGGLPNDLVTGVMAYAAGKAAGSYITAVGIAGLPPPTPALPRDLRSKTRLGKKS